MTEEQINDEVQENMSHKKKALSPSVIARQLSSFDKWEIDPNDFELQKRIGAGGFAEVFCGYRKSDGTVVAFKRLRNQQFDAQMLEMFKREVNILAKLKHFAILPFVGACTKPPFCIVTEFMSGGSLFSRLHTKDISDKLSPTQLTIIALGIAYGMAYLHDRQTIHRDLKSLNILLDADNFPRICDFGMARAKSNSSELMTGEIGTSQWMAPEVLISQKYNEKADVYSYGIILWEMLTGDIPYRGLREIQIAMSVVNQNNRPIIPKNCPQNLEKFIRICWDADPNKRPDFNTIVRALESGAISFPGTDISRLKAYVQQVSSEGQDEEETLNAEPVLLNIKDLSNDSLAQLVTEFINGNGPILPLLSALQSPDTLKKVSQFEIMPAVVSKLNYCTDAHTAAYLISLASHLFEEPELLDIFISAGGGQILLDVLVKFCTSNIPRILNCLLIVIKKEKLVFDAQHFSRISPFLLASDLSVREDAVDLISDVLARHDYENAEAFSETVENLLRNATPEAKSELLNKTIQLLLKLINIPLVATQMKQNNRADRLFQLIAHDSDEISLYSLQLMQILLSDTCPKVHAVVAFLDQFPTIISNGNDNCIFEALNAFTMIMASPAIYKEVSSRRQIVGCFAPCVTSNVPVIQALALRICYAFCANKLTESIFKPLFYTFITILQSPVEGSATLAAFCITALLTFEGVELFTGNDTDILKNFLQTSLATRKMVTAALRVIGTMSASLEGALIIDSWKLIKSVSNILTNSDDEEEKILAIMVLSAFSAAIPDSRSMFDCIPIFFDVCKNSHNQTICQYALICISNITVDPNCSTACVPFLNQLFVLLNNEEPQTHHYALEAIYKIFLTPEASTILDDRDTVIELLNSTKQIWKTDNIGILADILDSLSAVKMPCAVMRESGLLDLVVQKLSKMSISDSNRPKLIRIKSRLQSYV